MYSTQEEDKEEKEDVFQYIWIKLKYIWRVGSSSPQIDDSLELNRFNSVQGTTFTPRFMRSLLQ